MPKEQKIAAHREPAWVTKEEGQPESQFSAKCCLCVSKQSYSGIAT